MWISYNKGESIGTIGSENGTIKFDEEYPGYSRITVEDCERYHAITFGLYGSMVHTVYSDKDKYEDIVCKLKADILEFYSKERSLSEEVDFCKYLYMNY